MRNAAQYGARGKSTTRNDRRNGRNDRRSDHEVDYLVIFAKISDQSTIQFTAHCYNEHQATSIAWEEAREEGLDLNDLKLKTVKRLHQNN